MKAIASEETGEKKASKDAKMDWILMEKKWKNRSKIMKQFC